jgi:hypothetical protein
VALTFEQSTPGGVSLLHRWRLGFNQRWQYGGSWSWPTGHPLEIGYSSDNYWRDYNGLLNDVRYYSSILRCRAQISSIHNSGALADTNDLQLQFKFAAAPGPGHRSVVAGQPRRPAIGPTVTGPWTPVTGVSSPYTIVPAAGQQFFRYVYSNTNPQTLVSNPYLM